MYIIYQNTFQKRCLILSTYKDLSPESCFARDTTVSELTVVFIFEISMGKLR